jgi:Holliday junction DNA helicase RuvA
MIGLIRGIIVSKQAPDVIIDVQGLGYEVLVSLSTYFEMPNIGSEVLLHTHFVVRDDAQLLFGFSSLEERALFRQLIKINGVGPKMALAILSGMSTNEFSRAVQSNDIDTLVKLPGVGKKTAERLLIEMRDKISLVSENIDGLAGQVSDTSDIKQEAESALIALGYKPQDASKMINGVDESLTESSEQLIRAALKSMVAK